MKKLHFIFLLISQFIFSQELLVKYIYKPSSYRLFEENLYINKNTKISILDSIPFKSNSIELFNEDDSSINQMTKPKYSKYKKMVIDKNIKGYDNILEIDQIENINYQVVDNIPKINWDISHTDTKKIGKYTCKKATAEYRGSYYTAYYTREIPVSAGPYKFKGLPGLIMELKSDGINPKHWYATEVEFPYKGQIPINNHYIKTLPIITKKAFVEKADKKQKEELEIIASKRPKGAFRVESKLYRPGIEQKFEWENDKD